MATPTSSIKKGKQPQKKAPVAAKQSAGAVSLPSRIHYGAMVLIFILTMVVFYPMTRNGFIETWDDGAYILKNTLIRDLSGQGIVNMFRFGDDFQKLTNNYHPLTILSLAVNYQISGTDPSSYHFTNMLLHALNSVLVFLFIFLLVRRKLWPALITGLLFAVHPMHVESVAWATERKDVLYTLFFLWGLIVYIRYLDTRKGWLLALVFLLFICSCLSKAMAVPFPLVMVLVDLYRQRKFDLKMMAEKIPFLVIALVTGIMSVQLQATSAIEKFETFTLLQRTMHASYGFIAYLVRFFFPADLSAMYPYPAITPDGFLPTAFRAAPWVVLAIAGVFAWLATRKGEPARSLVFGILFYFLTIALVLQFISVGKAIMADRYTYLPFVGLGFIIGMVTAWLLEKKNALKYAGYGIAAVSVVMVMVFAMITRDRVRVWKDDITLWTNALEQYPDGRMDFIYEKRAKKYLEKEQTDAALADYMTILQHNPKNVNALESAGRIWGKYKRDMKRSVEFLEQAKAVDPQNAEVRKSLGVAYGMSGKFSESIENLLKAYELDQKDTSLVLNIAATYRYMGLPDKAREFDQVYRSMKSSK